MLPYSVEARYIRVNPQSWVGTIRLQVDILGCHTTITSATAATTTRSTTVILYSSTTPPTTGMGFGIRGLQASQSKFFFFSEPACTDPMGLSNGLLPLSLVTVSSVLNGNWLEYGPHLLTPQSSGQMGGWRPATDAKGEFVEVRSALRTVL